MVRNITTVALQAPIQKVWDVLTKPELVKQWQYGSDLITDWKVGNEIRFRTEWQGKVFEQWGKVLEVVPPTHIRYSLFAPRPDLEDKTENYFIMHYVLKNEKDKVVLEIIQEDNRPGAVPEEQQGDDNPALVALKKVVEDN